MPFLKVSLTTCLVCLTLTAVFNWLLDPYAVFDSVHTLIPRRYKQSTGSERLTKVIDIIRIKPEAIILGSSRVVMGIDPVTVSNLLNVTCYNGAVPGPTIDELYHTLEHTIAHQPQLQHVLLGLDLFCFNKNRRYEKNTSQAEHNRHGLFFSDYLNLLVSNTALKRSFIALKRCLGNSKKTLSLYCLNDLGFVPQSRPKCQKGLFCLHKLLKEELSTWITTPNLYGTFELDFEKLNLLKKMVDMCHARGIRLEIFINPAHMAYWYALHQQRHSNALHALQRHLVQYADVWDFSGNNEVTTDPLDRSTESLYIDIGHYLPRTGDMIVKTIYGQLQANFGRRISPQNVEEHIVGWEQGIAAWAQQNHDIVATINEQFPIPENKQIHASVSSQSIDLVIPREGLSAL